MLLRASLVCDACPGPFPSTPTSPLRSFIYCVASRLSLSPSFSLSLSLSHYDPISPLVPWLSLVTLHLLVSMRHIDLPGVKAHRGPVGNFCAPPRQFHPGLNLLLILLSPGRAPHYQAVSLCLIPASLLPDEMSITLRTGRVHSFQLSKFRHLPFSAQSASRVQSGRLRAPMQCLSGDNHRGYCLYQRPLSSQVSGVPCRSCGDRCHSSKGGC